MRPLDEWDRSDLQALIDGQVQEYLQLDYKASDALQNTDGKKAEIAKDVSAFANSAGGRIIYGVIEDKRFPVAIDAGSDPSKITKEWIENVILSGISPRVDGVRAREIALADDRAAFVVDIPQASSRAPHQAKDKRYYKRHEFQSVPMEDYEVKDVLRRSSRPELVIWLEFKDRMFDDATDTYLANLVGHVGNRSDEPAIYASIQIIIDASLSEGAIAGFDVAPKSVEHIFDGRSSSLKQYNKIITPNSHLPIYKEQPVSLFFLPVRMRRNVSFLFCYVATAPGFNRSAAFRLKNGNDIDAIPEYQINRSFIPEHW